MLQLFSDFDGTICEQDTLQLLLQRHASREWWILEQAWRSGRLATRDCLSAQLALLRCTPRQREQLVRSTSLTPGFVEFNRWRLEQGLTLTLLSDGLEPLIRAVLQHHGITEVSIQANRVDFSRQPLHLEFPHANPSHPECAMCKGGYLRRQRQPGRMSVYIGDGLSDRCAAGEADLLFAKSTLANHCRERKIAFHPWQDFFDITRQLANQPLPTRPSYARAAGGGS